MRKLLACITGKPRRDAVARCIRNQEKWYWEYRRLQPRWAGKHLTTAESRRQARAAKNIDIWYCKMLTLCPHWTEIFEADLYYPEELLPRNTP